MDFEPRVMELGITGYWPPSLFWEIMIPPANGPCVRYSVISAIFGWHIGGILIANTLM